MKDFRAEGLQAFRTLVLQALSCIQALSSLAFFTFRAVVPQCHGTENLRCLSAPGSKVFNPESLECQSVVVLEMFGAKASEFLNASGSKICGLEGF